MVKGKIVFEGARQVFVVRVPGVNGKIIERTVARPTSRSKRAMAAAERHAARALSELELDIAQQIAARDAEAADPFLAPSRQSIEEHLDDYEEFLKAGGWKGKTDASWRSKCLFRIRAILELAECTRIADIDAARIDSAIGKLKTLKHVRAEKTRKHYRNAIVDFGRWLELRRRAPTNPFADIVRINAAGDPAKRRRGWFTDEEAVRLVESAEVRGLQQYRGAHPTASLEALEKIRAKGEERAAVYRFALITGLRMDEIRTVTWSRITIKGDHLTVRVRAEDGKADRDDRISIVSEELCTDLAQRRVAQGSTRKRVTGGHLVFAVPKTILRRLYDDMEFGEIARVDDRGRHRDFHALRYTAARRLIIAGANPKYIQRLMRHSDIRMTFDLYGELEVDELLDAAPVAVPPLMAPTQKPTQNPPTDLENEA